MARKYDFNKIITRLFLLIGIGLTAHLIYLLNTTDKGTWSQLGRIGPLHLLGISLFALGPWVGHSLRIYFWSKFVDHPLSYRDSLSAVISNDVGSAVAPTLIGGGPLKYGMLVAKGMPAPKATFLVLLSATEDLFFYGTGFLCSFFFMRQNISAVGSALSGLKWPLIIFFSILALVFITTKLKWISAHQLRILLPEKIFLKYVNVRKRLVTFFAEIKDAYIQVFSRGKKYLVLSIFFLFTQWFSKFTILAIVLHALGIKMSLFDIYIKQWMIWVGLLIVPTPGGSGGAEAAFLLLFKNGLSGDMQNLVLSTWRFFTYYYILFLSVIIFQVVNKKSDRELVVE